MPDVRVPNMGIASKTFKKKIKNVPEVGINRKLIERCMIGIKKDHNRAEVIRSITRVKT